MTAIILLFSSLLITAQAKFNLTQFTKGFTQHMNADEQLKSLVKHGFECLNNGFQLLDSFLESSQEPQHFDIHSLLQEAKTFNEIAQCASTLQTLATLVREQINTTFIQTNFELSYPAILMRFHFLINEGPHLDPATLGANAFLVLRAIFFTGGLEQKYSMRPNQLIDFDLPRFYVEFFTGFSQKLYGNHSKAFQEIAKCLNQTHFIIADLGQHGQSVEDQLLGFAVRAPQLMEELGECLRSANNTMLSYSMFLQSLKSDPQMFLKGLRKNVLSGATLIHQFLVEGVEKILEGKYFEAGRDISRASKDGLGRYSQFFQSELGYMIENGLVNPERPFLLYE